MHQSERERNRERNREGKKERERCRICPELFFKGMKTDDLGIS
jgi:hypothetical protein